MSTAATTAALASRSLRTIRSELEFLADTSTISPSTLTHILSLLPTEQSSLCPPTPAAGPAPKSTTPAVPHPTFAAPPASEKTHLPIAPVAPPPPPTYTPTPLVLSLADALWAFPGSEPGDLPFPAGAKLEVLEKVKDDWWKGRVAGTAEPIGLFPSSYVRETQLLAQGGKPPLPNLPPRTATATGYGPGGNMMTDIAHGGPSQSTSVFEQQQQEEKEKKGGVLGKNGEKFGKKLGNAAIFGAGATIGGNIVNAIF